MKQEHVEIIRTALEDVMHECFMPYAEYVTLERALPRVEDGLKPVQRRILFAMNEMQILPDSKHKKCARIVGETMGKYHPHGDTSIYDALARMAQDFSMSIPLIDGQGNFGSIDGDGPAAMRYTEARLAPLALEMLRDIGKDTVPFQLNFDDTLKEPTLLPARYPNMLVNGATGIAVGLATNIPPHNLGEVIDGTVLRMKQPDCSLREVMAHIKAPDFPTGGVLMGGGELETAYATGKGKLTLRAKTEIETLPNGKSRIVVTELPYEVRESAMLKKIQALRESKKEMFAGVDSVRSETDRTGMRAVIELKKGVDAKRVLNCLFKYSDLQITYGVNLVAIADGQPKQMGLLQILDYYIDYQRKVVTRRVKYDIEQAQEREHKLAGLMIAVQNIDLVIKIIRSSANSREAKQRLMDRLALTGVQAQAILDLRLARLTQLEIDELKREYAEVIRLLAELNAILASRQKLDDTIISEMLQIKKRFAGARRTRLSGESAEITIDEGPLRAAEACAVILTRGGNLKRMNLKALARGAEGAEVERKNRPLSILETDTQSRVQFITNLGNQYTLYAAAIREAKFKDAGSPLNSLLAGLAKDEHILCMTTPGEGRLLTVTRGGMLKLTEFAELNTRKSKIAACGLKEGDELVLAQPLAPEPTLLLVTHKGMSLRLNKEEISVQGRAGKGVGGIRLAAGDQIILAAQVQDEGSVVVVSDAGFVKQTRLAEYEVQGRNGKGLKTFLWSKGAGSTLAAAFYVTQPAAFEAVTQSGQRYAFNTSEIPLEARYAKGAQLVPALLGDFVRQVERI